MSTGADLDVDQADDHNDTIADEPAESADVQAERLFEVNPSADPSFVVSEALQHGPARLRDFMQRHPDAKNMDLEVAIVHLETAGKERGPDGRVSEANRELVLQQMNVVHNILHNYNSHKNLVRDSQSAGQSQGLARVKITRDRSGQGAKQMFESTQNMLQLMFGKEEYEGFLRTTEGIKTLQATLTNQLRRSPDNPAYINFRDKYLGSTLRPRVLRQEIKAREAEKQRKYKEREQARLRAEANRPPPKVAAPKPKKGRRGGRGAPSAPSPRAPPPMGPPPPRQANRELPIDPKASPGKGDSVFGPFRVDVPQRLRGDRNLQMQAGRAYHNAVLHLNQHVSRMYDKKSNVYRYVRNKAKLDDRENIDRFTKIRQLLQTNFPGSNRDKVQEIAERKLTRMTRSEIEDIRRYVQKFPLRVKERATATHQLHETDPLRVQRMAQELDDELSKRIEYRSDTFKDAKELEHVLSRNILKLVHESQHHKDHTRARPTNWQTHLQADRPTEAFQIMGMDLGDRIPDAQVWMSELASRMPQVTTLDRDVKNPPEGDLPYYMQTREGRITHIQGYKDALNLVLANHRLRDFYKNGTDKDSGFYKDAKTVLVSVGPGEPKVPLSTLTERVHDFFRIRRNMAEPNKIPTAAIPKILQNLPHRDLKWAREYRRKVRALRAKGMQRKQPYKRAPDGHSRASTRQESISPSPDPPRRLRSDPNSRHYSDRATLAPSMERASWETQGGFRRDRSLSRSKPREMPEESDKRGAAGIESDYEDARYPAKTAEMDDYVTSPEYGGYAGGYDTDASVQVRQPPPLGTAGAPRFQPIPEDKPVIPAMPADYDPFAQPIQPRAGVVSDSATETEIDVPEVIKLPPVAKKGKVPIRKPKPVPKPAEEETVLPEEETEADFTETDTETEADAPDPIASRRPRRAAAKKGIEKRHKAEQDWQDWDVNQYKEDLAYAKSIGQGWETEEDDKSNTVGNSGIRGPPKLPIKFAMDDKLRDLYIQMGKDKALDITKYDPQKWIHEIRSLFDTYTKDAKFIKQYWPEKSVEHMQALQVELGGKNFPLQGVLDRILQQMEQDPENVFNKFNESLVTFWKAITKSYPRLGVELSRIRRRLKFKQERGVVASKPDPSLTETIEQRQPTPPPPSKPPPPPEEKAPEPPPTPAGPPPPKPKPKPTLPPAQPGPAPVKKPPSSRAMTWTREKDQAGYFFKMAGDDPTAIPRAVNAPNYKNWSVLDDRYVFSQQHAGAMTPVQETIVSEPWQAAHDKVEGRGKMTLQQRAQHRKDLERAIQLKPLPSSIRNLIHLGGPYRRTDHKGIRNQEQYRFKSEIFPKQTMEAVQFVLNGWGFHPDAPMGALIDMYRGFQQLTKVRDANSYFGFGHDPSKQKEIYVLHPDVHAAVKLTDGSLQRQQFKTNVNVRGNELDTMKQKHWSPFLPHIVQSEVVPQGTRGAAGIKVRSRSSVDHLHHVTLRDSGKSGEAAEHHLGTWDTLSLAMGHGDYKSGDAAAAAPYRPFNRLRDPHRIAGLQSHKTALAPHPLQSYFENFQTNMFGQIVVPFSDVLQIGSKMKHEDDAATIEKWHHSKNAKRNTADDAVIDVWTTYLKPGQNINEMFKGTFEDRAKFMIGKHKNHKLPFAKLLTGMGLKVPKAATVKDLFDRVKRHWGEFYFATDPDGPSLNALRLLRQNPTSKFPLGTKEEPVSVDAPAMPSTAPALEPDTDTEDDPIAKVAQTGGTVDPTGKHVASELTAEQIAAQKERQRLKLAAMELATKKKAAEARKKAAGQTYWLHQSIPQKSPVHMFKQEVLAHFQKHPEFKGKSDKDVKDWVKAKHDAFVSHVKNNFDMSQHGTDIDLDHSHAFHGHHIVRRLALQEGHVPDDENILLGMYLNPTNWAPRGGKTHGSQPSEDEIKDNLLFAAAHYGYSKPDLFDTKLARSKGIAFNFMTKFRTFKNSDIYKNRPGGTDLPSSDRVRKLLDHGDFPTMQRILQRSIAGIIKSDPDWKQYIGNDTFLHIGRGDKLHVDLPANAGLQRDGFSKSLEVLYQRRMEHKAKKSAAAAAFAASMAPAPPTDPDAVIPVAGGAAKILPAVPAPKPKLPSATPAKVLEEAKEEEKEAKANPLPASPPPSPRRRRARPAPIPPVRPPPRAPVRPPARAPAPARPRRRLHPLHNIVPIDQRKYLLNTRAMSKMEQARRGFDPNAGMVHMVMPSQDLVHTDAHIMKDLYEDSNKGVTNLLAKQRGPFRNEKGRSRIMSRSAHVAIRKRNTQLEITIKRGATVSELNNLHAKLGAHARSVPHAMLFLVTRGRQKIGKLMEIDFRELMNMIDVELLRKKTIGLLLVGDLQGGPMHKPHIHRGHFTRNTYNANTIHHT